MKAENGLANTLAQIEASERQKHDLIFALLAIRTQVKPATAMEVPHDQEQLQVASFLRTIDCVPDHGRYVYSGFASEPLVAEAAAQILKLDTLRGSIFRVILGDFGILKAKGERGELVARIILTIAHDIAARTRAATQGHDQLMYTKPIKVTDFLKALISNTDIDTVLKSKPPVHTMLQQTLEVAFKDAYINFSHFIKATDDTIINTDFVWQGLARVAAIMCFEVQKAVDFIIPVTFSASGEGPDKALLHPKNTSAILIQVKNRIQPKRNPVDAETLRFFRGGAETEKRPYISLQMELDGNEDQGNAPNITIVPRLNTSSTGTQSKEESQTDRQRYEIFLYGVRNAYGCIGPEDGDIVKKALESNTSSTESPHFKNRLTDPVSREAWDTANKMPVSFGEERNLVPVDDSE